MTRELVYTGFITLDGSVDSPGGTSEGHPGGGWVFDTELDPESYSLKGEELEETTALLFGRHSYEAFSGFWPTSADHAEYQDLPKVVVSTTLRDADLVDGWGPTTILRSTADVADLKQTDGGAIFIHGSAELARRLGEAGLIDRYNLLLFPYLLPGGKTIFGPQGVDRRNLSLRESATYANGVVKLVYDVRR
ncbi:dihydrofolate reductase family protein [Cellulosimicrobium marinum]|uniref:dihydrofolate reductase family protein n=1 Tax=Cellulosimicrobium marinum TaxID=1638992 RepID=UPI001E3813BD|nr:dihydrofolate reductase family protein [Cellulosimicrobium marinum]MCB7135927.1 dihydrofolate reductase family protein [Cellulosimicrobium marinum]